MLPDLSEARWRKSSASGGEGGQCVELANVGAIRDSKNPDGGALRLPFDALIAAVKTDSITR